MKMNDREMRRVVRRVCENVINEKDYGEFFRDFSDRLDSGKLFDYSDELTVEKWNDFDIEDKIVALNKEFGCLNLIDYIAEELGEDKMEDVLDGIAKKHLYL